MNRTKPILRWPGGKSRLLKKILPRIKPHVCYVEPFAGGLAVLCAKERSKVEVINDINGDLVALYLNVQRHLPEMMRQVDTLTASRKMFHLACEQPGYTEIERAANFLFRNRVSFSGGMTSFGVAKTAGGGVGLDRARVAELIHGMHERLNKVVIENISYDRCLDNYDSKDSFLFLDPPYLGAKIGAYKPWEESDVRGLRRRLDRVQGQWLLTLDDSAFNRQVFADCQLEAVTSKSGTVNRRTSAGKTFGELIITP